MAVGLSSLVLLVLSSCILVGGQRSCSLTDAQFRSSTVTVSAESVGGTTPGARVTWNTTLPPECVTSVTANFRTTRNGRLAATNTTTSTQTEIIQTGLRCTTYYYTRVVVTGEPRYQGAPVEQILLSNQVQVFVEAIPILFRVRAEVTADNASIKVSWEWSCQSVLDLLRVRYQPEGGSLMMHTVNNTTSTSATLSNLQCNTKYTIWVYYVKSGTGRTSVSRMVSLPARASPTPTNVTAQLMNASSVRVAWQWTRSGPVPSCFNTTTVSYRPEEGGESSLQLSDPAATEAILTDLQCNTNYTITMVTTAGQHRRESVAFLPLQGPQNLSAYVLSPTSIHLTWVAPCHTQQYHIYYRGTCGSYVDEGRLDTDRQEYTFDGLQEGVNYSFTVNQTGFSRGRVLPNGPVYARTFTAVPSGAPQSLEAVFVRPTEVSLRWRKVPCVQQNGPITDYIVRYYATCGADRNVQQNKSIGTMDDIINGLTPNTEYVFQVAAVNVNRTGPFSEPITLGGSPQLVMVSPVNSTTVTVSWSEVRCFNGSKAVSHYLVQYQSLCGGAVQNVTTNSLVQNVSGLALNVAVYTFRVAAVEASQKMGPLSKPVNTSLREHCADDPEDSSNSGLVEGAAVSVVMLVIAAVCIVVLVVWWRHRRGHRKNATVELADMADVDCKEEQDTDTSVDNVCYDTIHIIKKVSGKNASVNLTDMVGKGGAESKDQDTATSVDNICYNILPTSPPTILDYQRQVQCLEGEQVTLIVKTTGRPTPTVTWFFNGRKVEDDYSTELGKDGSLVLVSAEMKHAGTYTFTVSNREGSVKGCTKLVVHTEDENHARVESNPVAREKFGEFVSTFHAYNNTAFIGQFQALPSGEEGHQTTVGKTPANSLLNRFKNITAYDGHHVVLESISEGVDCEHDYINATYIDGYSQGKKYIATQGPLPNTVTDFWWLVWQEQVHIVAMITNTVEKGQQKCEQYWPDEGIKEYGPFKVTLTDQHVFADYTIRQLFVSCDKAGGSELKVTQFHFTSWPDHGVPEYAGPILNYLCRMKAQMKLSRGPTLVHCSAGVGRTGTLIAIDMALEQAAQENVVDIPAIVIIMRRQRMKMVQNSDQYVFIHDAVLESLTCGDTQIPASGLSGAIKKLKEKDRETGRTGFETQFHLLGLVTPKPTEVMRAYALRFPDLNRNLDFLPPESWRVVLKGESKDYIHASFANGYKQKRGFIIAQAPIKSTCRDFWKMVYERECGVIVMLSDLVENGEELCYQYWPADDTKGVQKYGEFTVSVLQTTKQDGFIQRIISITNPKSSHEHRVTQFQMSCWTPEGLCTSPPAIMAVIEQVLVIQRRTGNKPIVVHGSDTVSRCGVFCSFINATECCKTEGIVDVFQVVKALRIQKPGSVLTVEQYRFIFDLMLLFLESFTIYSNFK